MTYCICILQDIQKSVFIATEDPDVTVSNIFCVTPAKYSKLDAGAYLLRYQRVINFAGSKVARAFNPFYIGQYQHGWLRKLEILTNSLHVIYCKSIKFWCH